MICCARLQANSFQEVPTLSLLGPPWEFVVVKDPQVKKDLFRCYSEDNTGFIYWMEQQRPGAVNQTLIERNGKMEKLPGKFSHLLACPGETVTFLTAGGVGYGDPSERERAALERDLVLGYVSRSDPG